MTGRRRKKGRVQASDHRNHGKVGQGAKGVESTKERTPLSAKKNGINREVRIDAGEGKEEDRSRVLSGNKRET